MLLLASEIIARWFFGFGSGWHEIADDEIEYLPAPSMAYRWFGYTAHYNEYSMRSDSFPAQKSDANELRIMVLADSIVNGGTIVSQEELATELLKRRLGDTLLRPVVVGNIAAVSWGPPNLLAYVRRFGLFDADMVIVLTNAKDVWDVPRPLEERTPPRPPATFALQEVVIRVVGKLQRTGRAEAELKTEANAEASLGALRELIGLARDAGAKVAVVQHLSADELQHGEDDGTRLLAIELADLPMPLISTMEAYRAAAGDDRHSIYRDQIHLNVRGQQVLAEVLFDVVVELIGESPQP